MSVYCILYSLLYPNKLPCPRDWTEGLGGKERTRSTLYGGGVDSIRGGGRGGRGGRGKESIVGGE